MARQVDAHGLGGHLVVADGLDGAAIAGVDQQHHDGDAHAGDDEGNQRGEVERPAAGEGNVEIVEGGVVLEHVGAVGHRPQLLPLEHGADDLGKAQRGDGQIVALQAQHRQADQKGEQRRHKPREDQRGHHAQRHADGAVEVLIHRFARLVGKGEDGIGIAADEHEARLPQGKQAGKAVEQVHRNRHQGVGRALFENREKHGSGGQKLFEHEYGDIHRRDDGHRDPRGRVRPAAVGCKRFLHGARLLRPCRSSFPRTGPWA